MDDIHNINGADLECVYSYDSLDPDVLEIIVGSLESKGFRLKGRQPFFINTRDEPWGVAIPQNNSVSQFLNHVEDLPGVTQCGIKMLGRLDDVVTNLGIICDFENRVCTIWASDPFIWVLSGPSARSARRRRIAGFFDICQSLSEIKMPSFASVGAEPPRGEEINVENAEHNGFERFDTTVFFSQERMDDVLTWYTG